MSPSRRIGVCSWSLRPGSPSELVAALAETDLGLVQLALDPLRVGAWDEAETRAVLAAAGVRLASGMMAMRGEDYTTLETIRRTGGVAPDEHWEANLEAARDDARLARRLGIDLVSFHAGFLPHDPLDPRRGVLVERLRRVAECFAAEDVQLALETGQEGAETLLGFLEELAHPAVGVNFDPANMLLYGMGEPVAALLRLAPHVRQVHVKDARAASVPGTWGTEVPAGTGEVDWRAFGAALDEAGLACDLIVEREAGADRLADVRRARDLARELLGGEVGP